MRRIIISFIVVALLLSISGAAIAAAPPADNPGKGPPDLNKVVFVHYPKGLEAKGGIPGPPNNPPDDSDKLWYKYSGIHWATPTATYMYNPDNGYGDYIGAIEAGFSAWESVDGVDFSFEQVAWDGINTTGPNGISSLADETDGSNVVGWVDFDDYRFTNAIAVTMIWYTRTTGEIVEIDMAFNSNAKFAWHDNTTGENWTAGDTGGYDVDVQNIATHEAGHWLMLGDMYNKPAGEQTMFGISAEFDLAKRSLESGDIAGILEIYPAS